MSKKGFLEKFLNPTTCSSRFTILKDESINIKYFNVVGQNLQFKINTVPENIDPFEWVKEAMETILHSAVDRLQLQPNDKVGVTFCGSSFEERCINFKTASELKFKHVWEMIARLSQSDSQVLSTDTLYLNVSSVKLPQGQGRNKIYKNYEEECSKRRGILTINNKDGMCLPRSIVVAIASVEKHSNYKQMTNDTGKCQTLKAKELCENANVIIPTEGAGIPELEKFQTYLNNYKIVVYEYGYSGRNVIFEGAGEGKSLNLLHKDRHYNAIISLTSAFCCSYYCERCHVPFSQKNSHKCTKTCTCCQQSPECLYTPNNIDCSVCNRSFRGKKCFDNHKEHNICSAIQKCLQCLKVYKTIRNHSCDEYFCKTCRVRVPSDHDCCVKQNQKVPCLEKILFIFYHLKIKQEKVIGEKQLVGNFTGDITEPVPNLCVFQQRCSKCIDVASLFFCQDCGFRTKILSNNVIEEFLNYLLEIRKKFPKITVITHNGLALHYQFILHFLIEKTNLKPKLVMRGTKTIKLSLDCGNIKLIDSSNYFPISLSNLKQTFGFHSNTNKGYFPHLFNTSENENYLGVLPNKEFYSPDTMEYDDRQNFLKWYVEHEHDIFDMRKDIVEYCKKDVELFTEACLKFRSLMLQEYNVCPFMEGTTIGSTCDLVFTKKFLNPGTIGIIPKNKYRNGDNQSKIALQWLLWEESQRNLKIQHAGREKEVKLSGLKVDGFCADTNEVFEFHGCYYHGHKKCMKYGRDKPLYNDPRITLNLRYESTKTKIEKLRSLGYKVIVKWECDFRDEIKSNHQISILKNHSLVQSTPLNPSDAFYGGRTGNSKTLYKCQTGEKIKYVAICSIYTWVCKYGKFPIGHPKIYVGNETCVKLDLNKIDGLIKCKILPPDDLYHPVLPVKQNNKLMFSLCRACSDQLNNNKCKHSNEERALLGTWVIDEVKKAVEKGYKLLEIQEIWEYKIIKYDETACTQGIFTNLVNSFLKIKQESSGWPSECETNEEKVKYIADYLQKENINLEYTKITKNDAFRLFANLILNSFCGKICQRENQPMTSIINQPAELYNLLTNSAIIVNNILPINDNNIIVNWEYKEEVQNSLSIVNESIASYVTTQVRLKLYNYLEKLNDRALYYDTDSVIYISRNNEYEPETGNFVGDMTDKLEPYGKESYITKFICGGLKNCGYEVFSTRDNTTETVCIIKGICLKTSNIVDFQTIHEKLLLADNCNVSILSSNVRSTELNKIVTVPKIKNDQCKSEKRKFVNNYDSLPYGFKVRKM